MNKIILKSKICKFRKFKNSFEFVKIKIEFIGKNISKINTYIFNL